MPTKEEALTKIQSLVQRFDEQKEFYKDTDYNETQTRRDFIDPFWKALGWDVDNESGCAESYREVRHEDRLIIGGAAKAPDYSFRLSGGNLPKRRANLIEIHFGVAKFKRRRYKRESTIAKTASTHWCMNSID